MTTLLAPPDVVQCEPLAGGWWPTFEADPLPDASGSLADWLADQAAVYRLRQTSAADWLAGKLQELADLAVRLQARTPDDFDARLELEDATRDERIHTEGYAGGYDAATKELVPWACYSGLNP